MRGCRLPAERRKLRLRVGQALVHLQLKFVLFAPGAPLNCHSRLRTRVHPSTATRRSRCQPAEEAAETAQRASPAAFKAAAIIASGSIRLLLARVGAERPAAWKAAAITSFGLSEGCAPRVASISGRTVSCSSG